MLGGVGRKEENLYEKEFLKYALCPGSFNGMETPEWPYPVQTNAGSPESQTLVSGLQN